MSENNLNSTITNSDFLVDRVAKLDEDEMTEVLNIAGLLNQKLDTPFSENALNSSLSDIQELTNNKDLLEDIVGITAGIETVGLLAIAIKLFENSSLLNKTITSDTIATDQVNENVLAIIRDTEKVLLENDFNSIEEDSESLNKTGFEIPKNLLQGEEEPNSITEFLLEETGFNKHVVDNKSEIIEMWSSIDAEELIGSLNNSITKHSLFDSVVPEFGIPISISESVEIDESIVEEIEPTITSLETEAIASELENNVNILFKGLDELKNNVNII